MVTASHNPAEYNGVKFVGKSAEPLSKEGMEGVRDWAGIGCAAAGFRHPRHTDPGRQTADPILTA